jgi:hypothetical protein
MECYRRPRISFISSEADSASETIKWRLRQHLHGNGYIIASRIEDTCIFYILIEVPLHCQYLCLRTACVASLNVMCGFGKAAQPVRVKLEIISDCSCDWITRLDLIDTLVAILILVLRLFALLS